MRQPPRNFHCSLVMKRETIPLISGRTRIVDVCRNCGWQSTEIYSAAGQILMWRNDGFPGLAVSQKSEHKGRV